jgi:hypothetical protein
MNRLLGVLTVGLLVTGAMAQDLVGVWSGRYQVDMTKVAAENRQMVAEMSKSTRLTMRLRKDKTFSVEIVGKNQKSLTEGTYRIEKGKLITTDLKRNGKAVAAADRRNAAFTIANGGKSLTLKLDRGPAPAVLTFTKQ